MAYPQSQETRYLQLAEEMKVAYERIARAERQKDIGPSVKRMAMDSQRHPYSLLGMLY
jgi:hypothetical protein